MYFYSYFLFNQEAQSKTSQTANVHVTLGLMMPPAHPRLNHLFSQIAHFVKVARKRQKVKTELRKHILVSQLVHLNRKEKLGSRLAEQLGIGQKE